jgi:enoyl-CoA hydratase
MRLVSLTRLGVGAGMATEPPLLVDHRPDGIKLLRLNRPRVHNAVNAALVLALVDALAPGDERAVVVGSAAEGVFCSGLDVTLAESERVTVSDHLYELYERIATCPVPVIVAADGPAVGAGLQMVAAADLRVLAPKARLRVAGPAHGLAVAAWSLPSLVGRGRALDLCLTMRWVSAREALDMGLATRVDTDPLAVALEMAADIARLDGEAVRRVKALVGHSWAASRLVAEERDGNRHWSGWLAEARERG